MKRATIWMALTVLMVVSLVLVSCTSSTTSQTTSTTTTQSTFKTTPSTSSNSTTATTAKVTTTLSTTSTGNWWDSLGKPQYGGSLNYRVNADVQGWDVDIVNTNAPWDIWQDTLGGISWTTSPDKWDFKGKWAPDDVCGGDIMQSWEISTDLMTYTLHLRQGVHFALDPNSPASQLVGGREVTASDVVFSFNRLYGLGGYKMSSAANASLLNLMSVTAPDKYTNVFTFKSPSPWYFNTLMQPTTGNAIEPHEVIEKYGDMNNWHNIVGSAAYMLADYVSGSSAAWVRNPNYWGYDERYPKNQLPYIDKVNYLIIPDDATALAGLRTGKIDIVEGLSWSTAATVQKSAPQLLQVTRPNLGYCLNYRNDKTPFNDIRIRQAIQQAIDFSTIGKNYYGGTVSGVPAGIVTPAWTGWYIPFAQWPQAQKDEFAYNPTAAKQLLAAAGYPNGFNTTVIAPSNYDLDLLQIYKAYLAAIGINMTIIVTDYPTFLSSDIIAGKYDQMIYNNTTGYLQPPNRIISHFHSTEPPSGNSCFVKDPAYDAIFDKFSVETDPAQQRALMQQADTYGLTHFFQLAGLPTVEYVLYQPWFKGFQGQVFYFWTKMSIARFWIDQPLKKSMGY